MAPRRKTSKLTAQPAPSAAQPVPEGDEGDISEAMQVINSLAKSNDGVEWEIKVYERVRTGRPGGAQPFLFNVDLDELKDLEDRLADEFPMGGQYRVMCRANGKVVKSFCLDIAKRPGYRPPRPSYVQETIQPPPAPAHAATDPAILALLADIARRQEQSERDNRSFMESVIQRLNQPSTSLSDRISEFKTFLELMPRPNPELSMTMLKEGIALGKMAIGAGAAEGTAAGSGGLLGIVERLLTPEVVGKIAENIGHAPAEQPQQQRPALNQPIEVRPGPMIVPGAQAPQSQTPFDPVAQMTAGMEWLFEKAAQGADPALLAEQVLNTVPVSILDELSEADSPVDLLATKFPRVHQYRAWFEALLENIFEPDDSPADGSGAAANGANEPTAAKNPTH